MGKRLLIAQQPHSSANRPTICVDAKSASRQCNLAAALVLLYHIARDAASVVVFPATLGSSKQRGLALIPPRSPWKYFENISLLQLEDRASRSHPQWRRYIGDEPTRAIRKSRFGRQSKVRATAARIVLGHKRVFGNAGARDRRMRSLKRHTDRNPPPERMRMSYLNKRSKSHV